MAVYVDFAQNSYGRMKMCHMWADSAAELHAMADAIGVARKWYQVADGPHHASFPHYDIAQSKRRIAVAKGAREMDRRGGYLCRKRIRSSISDNPAPWRYAAAQAMETRQGEDAGQASSDRMTARSQRDAPKTSQ